MAPAKVETLKSLPVPETQKRLKHFLGHFIQDYSSIALHSTHHDKFTDYPLTTVTAILALKNLFSSVPILQLSEIERQLVVDQYVLNVPVGPVLSTRSTGDQKLHSCAFLSWCLCHSKQKNRISGYGPLHRRKLVPVLAHPVPVSAWTTKVWCNPVGPCFKIYLPPRGPENLSCPPTVFSWPHSDTLGYVNVCPTCNRSKPRPFMCHTAHGQLRPNHVFHLHGTKWASCECSRR